jgi:hypothetical protein
MKDQTPKCLDVTLDKAEVKHAAGEMERVHKGKLQGEVGALSEESDDIRMPLTQIIESTHFSENSVCPKGTGGERCECYVFSPIRALDTKQFSQFTIHVYISSTPKHLPPAGTPTDDSMWFKLRRGTVDLQSLQTTPDVFST